LGADRDIGSWIRRQLLRRDWTAADLARRIDVSTGAISEWIAGKRRPSPASCLKLAEAFNVEPDDVLALAGHRLPTTPLRADDPRNRIIALIKRVHMTPSQAAGLEAMLTAWLETDDTGAPATNGS
jgi:transcriptional regulator with XRE-family HTH domain